MEEVIQRVAKGLGMKREELCRRGGGDGAGGPDGVFASVYSGKSGRNREADGGRGLQLGESNAWGVEALDDEGCRCKAIVSESGGDLSHSQVKI